MFCISADSGQNLAVFRKDSAPKVDSSPTKPLAVSPVLEATAAWSWRILVVSAAVALGAIVFYQLRVVTVPVFLAIVLSTLLVPPAHFLQSKGLRPALSTAVVFFGSLLLLGGLVYVLSAPVSEEFADLGPQVSSAIDDVNNWLVTGPLELDQTELDRYVDSVVQSAQENAQNLGTGVVSSATLAAEILAGFILTIVLTFFFTKDGPRLARAIIDRFPLQRREVVTAAGLRAYHTLGGYLRGVALTGVIDALFIGVALFFIGVPLLLPLVVLTFFGAFFPVVGATLAGALAAAVALVNGGPTDALLVIIAVLIVQQIEGHLLQPLLVGRAVALHPVVIICALGVGAVVAGILGAFLAVPVAAVVGAVVRELELRAEGVEDTNPEEGLAT